MWSEILSKHRKRKGVRGRREEKEGRRKYGKEQKEGGKEREEGKKEEENVSGPDVFLVPNHPGFHSETLSQCSPKKADLGFFLGHRIFVELSLAEHPSSEKHKPKTHQNLFFLNMVFMRHSLGCSVLCMISSLCKIMAKQGL